MLLTVTLISHLAANNNQVKINDVTRCDVLRDMSSLVIELKKGRRLFVRGKTRSDKTKSRDSPKR